MRVLTTNHSNYHLHRKVGIDHDNHRNYDDRDRQEEQILQSDRSSPRRRNRSTTTTAYFANSGLLLAFTFLVIAFIGGFVPNSSANGFRIMGRETGEKEVKKWEVEEAN